MSDWAFRVVNLRYVNIDYRRRGSKTAEMQTGNGLTNKSTSEIRKLIKNNFGNFKIPLNDFCSSFLIIKISILILCKKKFVRYQVKSSREEFPVSIYTEFLKRIPIDLRGVGCMHRCVSDCVGRRKVFVHSVGKVLQASQGQRCMSG